MSRPARHDIDLSALPTVADVDDDDLIDRDSAWHEHQRTKQRQAEVEAAAQTYAEPEPVEEAPHETAWPAEAETEAVNEPEPAAEAHAEPELLQEANEAELEPEDAFEPVMDADVFLEDEAPVHEPEPEPEVVRAPERAVEPPPRRAPAREEARAEKMRVIETPPVSFSSSSKAAREETESSAAKTESKENDVVSEEHHHPVEVPKPPPEEPLTPEEQKRRYWQMLKEKIGLGSLGWSVAIHVALLLIATLIGISQAIDKQVDFLPGGSPAGEAASEALEHKVQQKKNPWLKNKPQLRRVTVQSMATDVQLPEMDMDSLDLSGITDRMQLGKMGGLGAGGGMGMGGSGGGFGAGIGKGGMFSFLGQTAFGRRVVFVVDVSASMSAAGEGGTTRFDVLKKELAKSLSRLPHGTQYQILFFSDFAWPHNIV
ncbi:MAG: hypothetical protein JNG86_14250, partial [Verrucomicrobiaceae bacterium]|nr:hypothetical protein [Verrucomicrobiaceae bacterium]